MRQSAQLSWWWKRNMVDGDLSDDADFEGRPYCATAGQEDRYRRFALLLRECEQELEHLKSLDPGEESDQFLSLAAELDELRPCLLNYRGELNLHPSHHPGREARILAGKPRQSRKPRKGLRGIRGGKGK